MNTNDLLAIKHDVNITVDTASLIKVGLMSIIVTTFGVLLVHLFRWIEK